MTDVQERAPIKSTTGLDRDSVPWRLWEKAKESFWDPKTIDFSKDATDFASFTDEQKRRVAASARGFMVGEEAVTIDILPLIRAISIEGRLEETIYLTSFALEEAKHVDFFRLFFDSIGFDPLSLEEAPTAQRNGQGPLSNLFSGGLGEIMGRLDTDRSPEAYLDAALMYNQFVEGVLALAGYRGWQQLFTSLGGHVLPGFQEGLRLVQKDERRHIAYGTYLIRRIVAEHPESWTFVERRWEELTGPILFMAEAFKERRAQGQTTGGGRMGYGTIDIDFVVTQCARRLEMLRVSTGTTADQVEHATIESFEPTEMAEITA